jgi:threonine dehydratase
LERGLAADGRLVRFSAVVSDRPGGIAKLTRVIYEAGASIKDIEHERAWLESDIFSVNVIVVAETTSRAHALSLKEALDKAGYECQWSRS